MKIRNHVYKVSSTVPSTKVDTQDIFVAIIITTTGNMENEGVSQDLTSLVTINFISYFRYIVKILYLFNFDRFSYFTQQHRYFFIGCIVLKLPWLPSISSGGHAIIYVIISLVLINYAASNFSRDIFGIQLIPFLWNISNS